MDSVDTIEPVKTGRATPRHAPTVKAEAGGGKRGTSYNPKPPTIPRPPRKEDDEEEENFFQRHRVAVIVGALVLAGVSWYFFGKPSAPSEPVRKAPEPRMVTLVLPPPPPPPPPPKVLPPPPKDERKIEQTPVDKPVDKPVEKPAEKPPEALGTSIKGAGPGMAGLSSGSGNGMIGGTGTGRGGGGSVARYYAGQVGSKVAEALRNHRKTRTSNMRVEAQVWLDASGKITRATLDRSTGDASLDETLKNEVLPGIQLAEPPPKGMRMPIPLRLTARRPN